MARQYQTDELQPDRELNMNRLLGRPMGNEEDGRSQVISTDVWDAIEGVMPALLKPFTSTDEYVKFTPVGEEDVPGAEQETDYINHLIAHKNNGYMLFYRWFWDALTCKYGIVEYCWEEDISSTTERYEGLADEELAILTQNPNVTIEAISSRPDPMAQPSMDQMGVPTTPPMVHDVTIRVTETEGHARIYNVPPEEFIFNADLSTQSIKDARFVQREVFKTISDIRELGYEIDDDIVDDGQDYFTSIERSNRFDNWRDYTDHGTTTEDNPNRLVLFKTTYCRHDLNGDGIAELLKIVRIGDTILEMGETEEIPFSAIHCHIIPHKFAGVAKADVVVPVQDLKTTLWRQALDNIYGINSNRTFVSSRVDLDDMLSNPLGGIVRVDADTAHGHAVSVPIQPIVGIIQPMIEYADTVKENRTGFTRYSSGMDADSLNKTATGISKIMDASQQRNEMQARIFAEGVKDLMLGLHGLVRRHATKQEIVQLRNKWVPVDPRNWKTRKDMTVSVGIGTGDKQQTIQNMKLIGEVQEKVMPLGLADKKSLYNALRRGVEAMGYKDVAQFFIEPQDGTMPPPQPNPDLIKAKHAHVEKMLTIALDAVQTGVMPPEMFMQGFIAAVQQDASQPMQPPMPPQQGMM